MAITLNIDSGQIDKDETKKLTISPKDSDDAGFDLTDLVVTFTAPSGDVTTYAENATGDEVEIDPPSSNVYTIYHTFDEAGPWKLKVTGTDSNGYVEVETGLIKVIQT